MGRNRRSTSWDRVGEIFNPRGLVDVVKKLRMGQLIRVKFVDRSKPDVFGCYDGRLIWEGPISNGIRVGGECFELRDIAKISSMGFEELHDLEPGDVITLHFRPQGTEVSWLIDHIARGDVEVSPEDAMALDDVVSNGVWPDDHNRTVIVILRNCGELILVQYWEVLTSVGVKRRRPLVDLDCLRQVDGEPFWPKANVTMCFRSGAADAVFSVLAIKEQTAKIGGSTSRLEQLFNAGCYGNPLARTVRVVQHLHEDPAALAKFKKEVVPHLELLRAIPQ